MERIAVGVDGSQAADRALRWAVREAELHGAAIDLVHAYVIHPYASLFGNTDRNLAEARLDEVIERNRALLDRVTWSSTLVDATGTAVAALVDAAEDADLVVVGSRGAGGFARLTLGSTAYRTAAHAPAPVAVIAGDDTDTDTAGDRSIVVGIDDAPVSRRALRWALEEAGCRATSVTVVHSYLLPIDMAPAAALDQGRFERACAQARDAAAGLIDRVVGAARIPPGVEVSRIVDAGPPAGTLLDYAEGRLLVVGTRGQGGLSHTVFGSVSQQVLHHADHPVVVVP
jgi:nucleotide-binding universal stress UspA family protein